MKIVHSCFSISCINKTLSFISPALVILVPVLVTLIAVTFAFVVIPTVSFTFVHNTFVFYCFVSVQFNYFMAVFTDPNKHQNTNLLPPNFLQPVEISSPADFCVKCQQEKHERVHHCSICNRCIARYDHHCPWIHNCVGYSNHVYFYRFLVFAAFGLLYVALFSTRIFWLAFLSSKRQAFVWPLRFMRPIFLFVFLISVLIGTSLIGLVSWQTFLMVTNQTTVEFYKNQVAKALHLSDDVPFRSPYDYGYKQNLSLFFQISKTRPWWKLLLPIPINQEEVK